MTRSTSSISARLAAGILALFLRDALHRDVALPVEALADAEPGRAGLAVDEDGGLRGGALRGAWPCGRLVSTRVMACSFNPIRASAIAAGMAHRRLSS